MTPPTGVLYLNERDVSDLGLGVLSLADWWSAPVQERAFVSPIGAAGSHPASQARMLPRRIPLKLMLDDVTKETRIAALHRVYHLAGSGLLEVRVGDDTNLYATGVLERAGGSGSWADHVVFSQGELDLDWDLVCYDPVKYGREPRIYGLPTAVRRKISLGTLPSLGSLWIFGAATTPQVIVRGATGDQVATMTFATLAAATDAYHVDLTNQAITKYASGVATDSFASWTAGEWFALDPTYADVDGEGLTVELSTGTGSLEIELAYR